MTALPSGTLRQITDAISQVKEAGDFRKPDKTASAKLYSRARTMRDRGLILTTNATSQGKEIVYSAADIVAAVLAITILDNGGSAGKIKAINGQLRTIGNTNGKPEFERNVERILQGVPVFVRLDILTHPWPHTHSLMGTASEVPSVEDFTWYDSYNHLNRITESTRWDVTNLALPVLQALIREED